MTHKALLAACGAFGCAVLTATPAAAAAEESTLVSGKAFADVTHLDAQNDGVDSATNGTGIDVKRFYLGVAHNFDDIWSINLTTDFNYVANDGETQLFVKKAYLQAKLSDAFIGRLGSADLPWVTFVEELYGYRYVENVIVDRLRFGTSADWGIHATGKMAAGRMNYAVAVVNGAGFKNPTRSNSMDVEARIGFVPLPGLTLALGGYSGKLGKDVAGSATPPQHTAQRVDVLAAYVSGPLRAGGEYFHAKDWNQVTTQAADSARGLSIWASYDFTPRWSLFARADSAKPSRDLNAALEDEYVNLGVAAHPRKNVDVAFVYKHEKVDGGGTVATSNGTLGGLREGKYDELGVWCQVVF
jgi:hypothetical protein